jgi:hypothetical protein
MGTVLMPAVRPTSKRSWWVDIKIFCIAVLIGSPAAIGAGYLAAQYQNSLQPQVSDAVLAPPTTTPLQIPDIIVEVKPTRVETETVVVSPEPRIPETQRNRTSRHAKPEPERSLADVPPVVPQTPPPPPVTTPPPAAGTHRAPASTTVTPTLSPVYDQLRSETVAADPSLESDLPR